MNKAAKKDPMTSTRGPQASRRQGRRLSPPAFQISKVPIQTKLTIGQPGDRFEREADSIADKVMQRISTPAPSKAAGKTPAVQRKCADCEEKVQRQPAEEEEEQVWAKPLAGEITPMIQRQGELEEEAPNATELEEDSDEAPLDEESVESNEALPTENTGELEDDRLSPKAQPGSIVQQASPSLASRLQSTKGGGQPLPKNTLTQMESAFGTDFSGVRIHTGQPAVRMNRELHAQAFTHGRDIYFNQGRFRPETCAGQRLLAHELVHVGQQGGSRKSIQKQGSSKKKRILLWRLISKAQVSNEDLMRTTHFRSFLVLARGNKAKALEGCRRYHSYLHHVYIAKDVKPFSAFRGKGLIYKMRWFLGIGSGLIAYRRKRATKASIRRLRIAADYHRRMAGGEDAASRHLPGHLEYATSDKTQKQKLGEDRSDSEFDEHRMTDPLKKRLHLLHPKVVRELKKHHLERDPTGRRKEKIERLAVRGINQLLDLKIAFDRANAANPLSDFNPSNTHLKQAADLYEHLANQAVLNKNVDFFLKGIKATPGGHEIEKNRFLRKFQKLMGGNTDLKDFIELALKKYKPYLLAVKLLKPKRQQTAGKLLIKDASIALGSVVKEFVSPNPASLMRKLITKIVKGSFKNLSNAEKKNYTLHYGMGYAWGIVGMAKGKNLGRPTRQEEGYKQMYLAGWRDARRALTSVSARGPMGKHLIDTALAPYRKMDDTQAFLAAWKIAYQKIKRMLNPRSRELYRTSPHAL